jgi:hypothetical protein
MIKTIKTPSSPRPKAPQATTPETLARATESPPQGLADLPQDFFGEIAGHLSTRDQAALSHVSKAIHGPIINNPTLLLNQKRARNAIEHAVNNFRGDVFLLQQQLTAVGHQHRRPKTLAHVREIALRNNQLTPEGLLAFCHWAKKNLSNLNNLQVHYSDTWPYPCNCSDFSVLTSLVSLRSLKIVIPTRFAESSLDGHISNVGNLPNLAEIHLEGVEPRGLEKATGLRRVCFLSTKCQDYINQIAVPHAVEELHVKEIKKTFGVLRLEQFKSLNSLTAENICIDLDALPLGLKKLNALHMTTLRGEQPISRYTHLTELILDKAEKNHTVKTEHLKSLSHLEVLHFKTLFQPVDSLQGFKSASSLKKICLNGLRPCQTISRTLFS